MNNKKIPPPPPRCNGTLYKVRQGETLFSIAKNFGISLQAIINANPQIKDPNSITVGQYICIPREDIFMFSTGPLALDPEMQKFVGVIVENNSISTITTTILLFNKDTCPKTLAVKLDATLPPGCLFPPFFDPPGFFYEVQVQVPDVLNIFVAVYGLTENFGVVAGNTLRHQELVILFNPEEFGGFTPQQTRKITDISASAGQWVKVI